MGDIVTFKSAAAAPPGRVRRTRPAKILLFIGVQYCRAEGADAGRPSHQAGPPPARKPDPQRPPKKRA
jgi:hypothetical protein